MKHGQGRSGGWGRGATSGNSGGQGADGRQGQVERPGGAGLPREGWPHGTQKCGSNELGRTQNCVVSVCLLLRLGRLFTLDSSRVQKKRTAQRGGILSSNLRAAEARKAVLQFLYLRKRNRTFIVLLGCRYSDKSALDRHSSWCGGVSL